VAFARESGFNWLIQQVMRLLSFGIRRKARQRGVSYSGSGLSVPGDQQSDGVPGEGTRKGQGRHQHEMRRHFFGCGT